MAPLNPHQAWLQAGNAQLAIGQGGSSLALPVDVADVVDVVVYFAHVAALPVQVIYPYCLRLARLCRALSQGVPRACQEWTPGVWYARHLQALAPLSGSAAVVVAFVIVVGRGVARGQGQVQTLSVVGVCARFVWILTVTLQVFRFWLSRQFLKAEAAAVVVLFALIVVVVVAG